MLKQQSIELSEVVSQISKLKAKIKTWKFQNKIIGLVPTMGALHEGHESLIKKAKESCDIVIVSIFVNPIQFSPNEDLDKYPKQLLEDRRICSKYLVDTIFAPTPGEMYPEGDDLTKICPPDYLKNKLCGKTRLRHFDGVATIVLKLFNIVQPDKAFFGQKDAQQLIIVNKMCKDLNIDTEIISCPIIREDNGLALSSRNSYLSSTDKEKALILSETLKKMVELYSSGISSKKEVVSIVMQDINPDIKLEYLDVYNMDTLEPAETIISNSLVAIAAYVGGVRLIDNIII